MLTPFSIKKVLMRGISPNTNATQQEEGLSALVNLQPHNGALSTPEVRETETVGNFNWTLEPHLIARQGTDEIYFGQIFGWNTPAFFLNLVGQHPDSPPAAMYYVDDTGIAAPVVRLAGKLCDESKELNVLMSDGTLYRNETGIWDGTEEVWSKIVNYATYVSEFRNRPVIVGPGAGLFDAFDTALTKYMSSMGVTSYETALNVPTFSTLIPADQRPRAILWGGLFGAVIKTIENPEASLIGAEVPIVATKVELEPHIYELVYNGTTSITVTIVCDETSAVLYTATLAPDGTEGSVYLPVVTTPGTYTVTLTGDGATVKIYNNYVEEFLKRQDWGFTVLPEDAGAIRASYSLSGHIIAVCERAIYALTPLSAHPSFSINKISSMQTLNAYTYQETSGTQVVVFGLDGYMYTIDNKLAVTKLCKPKFTVPDCRLWCTDDEICVTPALTGNSIWFRNGIQHTTTRRKYTTDLYSTDTSTTATATTYLINCDVAGRKRLERIQLVGQGAWKVRVWTRIQHGQTRVLVLDREFTYSDAIDCSIEGQSFLFEFTGIRSSGLMVEDVILWWRAPGRARDAARPNNQWFR